MSATRPYVPVAKTVSVTGIPVTAGDPPKTRKLIAAEHKFKLANEEHAAAQARYDSAFKAAAITWDTPLGESIKRKNEELLSEKALRAAALAVKRATRTLLNNGGTIHEQTEAGR